MRLTGGAGEGCSGLSEGKDRPPGASADSLRPPGPMCGPSPPAGFSYRRGWIPSSSGLLNED